MKLIFAIALLAAGLIQTHAAGTYLLLTQTNSLAAGITNAAKAYADTKQASGNYITALTGDVTATGPGSVASTLVNTAVTGGSYGDATHVGTFTVDGKGRLTAAGSTTITGTAPGGAAGAVLSGTYPNPGFSFGSVSSATNLLVTGGVQTDYGRFTNNVTLGSSGYLNLPTSVWSVVSGSSGETNRIFFDSTSAYLNGNFNLRKTAAGIDQVLYDGTTFTVKIPAVLTGTANIGGVLTATNAALVTPNIGAATATSLLLSNPLETQVSLTHAGTVTLSLSPVYSEADIGITGSVTFATSALAVTHRYTLFGRNTQATNATPTFPAWVFQGGAPSTITAGKAFTLSLECRVTANDTNVWAAYAEAQ